MAGGAHHWQLWQAEVVDVRPGGDEALAARLHFTAMLHHQVLLEHVQVFERAEAREAEVILLIGCTVVVQGALVLKWPEADFASVVLLPDVLLELEEGGDVRSSANPAGEPCPRSGGGGGPATHVRYQRAVVEEIVLTNVAGQHLSLVSVCSVRLQCLMGLAVTSWVIGLEVVLEGLLSVTVSEHHFPAAFGLALQSLDPLYRQVGGVSRLVDHHHVREEKGSFHPNNPTLLTEQTTRLTLSVHCSS